jgi:DNA replication protein DnaC
VVVTTPAAPPLPDELTALLRRMRLPYLRTAAPDVLATARTQRWDPAETLRVLLAEEVAGRDDATRRQHRRAAGLPAGKTFTSWREADSSIPAPTRHALATLEWIGRAENLAVTGPSGTGKTHLVEALAHAAIDTGRRVAWFTLESLTAAVGRAGADGSVARTITKITRADLIVVDDIGMLPAGHPAAEAIYRVIDAAYELGRGHLQPAPLGLRHDHAQDAGHSDGRSTTPPRPHRAHRGHQPAPGRGHRRQGGDPLDLDQQEIS